MVHSLSSQIQKGSGGDGGKKQLIFQSITLLPFHYDSLDLYECFVLTVVNNFGWDVPVWWYLSMLHGMSSEKTC